MVDIGNFVMFFFWLKKHSYGPMHCGRTAVFFFGGVGMARSTMSRGPVMKGLRPLCSFK